MSGFKDSTKTVSGHHDWNGSSVGTPPQVYPPNGDRTHGNAATQRTNPPTQELEAHGGRSPLLPGFKHGGQARHFHVHKHFHAKGGSHTVSQSYKREEKTAERFAEGGHVHDGTSPPASGPDYAKGGMHINPKHRGKFTQKMTGSKTGKLTGKDVQRGLHAKSGETRKEANFARMARRHFEPLHKNAGGALYATGGTINKLALGGVPMQGTPATGALGRLAIRPQGLPTRAGPALRRPMPMPGPTPMARAGGGGIPSQGRKKP